MDVSKAEPIFRTEKYREIKAKTTLDLVNVDEEVSQIPNLLQECGESAALAIEIYDTAKEDLERIKAEVAEGIRREPTSNGKQKSETAIEAVVPLSKLYQEQLVELSQARVDAALWKNLMNSIQAKSFSIRTAADLVTSGFISTDYVMKRRRQEIRDVKVNA